MIINKIELQGFSSYRDFTSVTVPTDIVGITGEYDYGIPDRSNGTGKTSLVMSIIFTLYGKGEFSSSFKELINDAYSKKDEMFSKVVFTLNGNEYECIRGFKNGDSYLDFFENGNKRGDRISDTQEHINNVIGMDYNMFTASIFFEQSKANKFINTQAEKRREYVDKVLGLEIWRDRYKAVVKDLKNKRVFIENLIKEINLLEIDKNKYEEVVSLKSDVTKNLNNLQNKKQNNEEYLHTISKNQHLFEVIETTRIELGKLYDTIISSKNKIDSLEKEKQELNQKYNSYKLQEYNIITTDTEPLKKEIDDLSIQEKEKQQVISSINIEINTATSDMKYLINEKNTIQKGNCPTCKQFVSEDYFNDFQNKYNNNISELQVTIEKLNNELQKEKNESNNIIAIIGEKNIELSKITKENSDKLQQKHNRDLELTALNSKIENISNQITSWNDNIKNYQELYDSKNEELAELEDKIKNIENSLEEIDRIKKENIQINEEINIYQHKIANIHIAEENLKSIINTLNEKNECLKKEQYTLSLLEELSNSFQKIPEKIFSESLISIKEYVDSLLHTIYSNIELDIYEDDSKNKKLIIGFLVNGKQRSYERMSGGQKVICDICLRIGFSKVIMQRAQTKLNFVALDEPFTALDKVNREAVQNIFSSMLNEFKQILIITHTEDVENYPRTINVKMNKDGVSYIN